MVHYVYLVAYHEGTRKRVPAHWAIMVTSDSDGSTGKVYHAIGNPFQGYHHEIKPSYNISKTKRRYTRTLLDTIEDAALDSLDQIALSVGCPSRSPAPLDPFAVKSPHLDTR